MKHCNLFLCLFVLLIASSVLAAVPNITTVTDSPDPVDVGSSINFDVSWTDDDGNSAKLYVCKSSNFDAGSRSCNDGIWCSSDYNSIPDFSSCSYTAQDADIGNNTYYAFVCDDAACSSSSSGDFTVNANPVCSITSATTPIAKDSSTTVSISYSGFGGDPTGYTSIDCGDAGASGGSISCSGGSCSLDCGPYANAEDYTIKDLIELTDGSNDANCDGSATVNVDCTCPAISVKSIAGDSSSPYWDTVNDNTTTLIISGETGMACKFDSVDKDFYSLLSNDCTTSGSEATCALGNLDQNNYTYYYACVDSLDNNTAVSAVSFVVDWSAPAKVTGLSASVQSSSEITITWNTNSENDFDYYKIYRNDSEIATVDEGTTSYNDSGLSSGTSYTYKVSAVDDAGNEGGKSDPASATTTTESGTTPSNPDVESDTHSDNEWSSNDDVELSWDSVSGANSYDCSWKTSDSKSWSDCSSPYSKDDVDDDTYYFYARACSGSNCSSGDGFIVRIDTTAPDSPEEVSVEADDDGTILIEWDYASDPSPGSGIDVYRIYRDTKKEVSINSASLIATADSDETSYRDDDNDLIEGTRYYYKIVAVDNAGNASSASDYDSATVTGRQCKFSVTYNFTEYIPGGTPTLIIESSTDMTSPVINVRDTTDSGWLVRQNIETTSRKVEATYKVPTDKDGHNIEIIFKASDGDKTCRFLKNLRVDSKKPTVSFEELLDNADVNGIVELKAEASDDRSGIKEVNFYYKDGDDWKLIAKATLSDDIYSTDLDTTSLENKSYEIKAEAKDNAGNTAEETIKVNVSNVPPEDEETVYKTEKYEFGEAELERLLRESGLEEGLIDEAIGLMEEEAIERELIITRKGVVYKAKVVIKFKNNWDEIISVQIVELIPKSFAESADDIESDLDFAIIEKDPIIQFVVENVNPNEEIELSYSLKDSLTKEGADELIEVMEEFAAPPIVLEKDSDISESFKEGGFSPITGLLGLFNIGNALMLFGGLVVILIVIAIILVIIAGGAFVFRGRESASKEPEMPGLHTAIKSTELGGMRDLSDRLKDLFGPKEKGKEGKFSYKAK